MDNATRALKNSRELLFEIGEERFGAPNEQVRAEINALEDLPRLKIRVVQANKVNSWEELLS